HATSSTLFPYTTLFRSRRDDERVGRHADDGEIERFRSVPVELVARVDRHELFRRDPERAEAALEHRPPNRFRAADDAVDARTNRSEEHTSERQSRENLV